MSVICDDENAAIDNDQYHYLTTSTMHNSNHRFSCGWQMIEYRKTCVNSFSLHQKKLLINRECDQILRILTMFVKPNRDNIYLMNLTKLTEKRGAKKDVAK